jgi:hypothetical protein
MKRTILAVGATLLLAGPALAAEQPQRSRWCVAPQDTDCWVDLNYAARMAMEEKMSPCMTPAMDIDCLFAVGWRKPLYEDERFKPRTIYRGKTQ